VKKTNVYRERLRRLLLQVMYTPDELRDVLSQAVFNVTRDVRWRVDALSPRLAGVAARLATLARPVTGGGVDQLGDVFDESAVQVAIDELSSPSAPRPSGQSTVVIDDETDGNKDGPPTTSLTSVYYKTPRLLTIQIESIIFADRNNPNQIAMQSSSELLVQAIGTIKEIYEMSKIFRFYSCYKKRNNEQHTDHVLCLTYRRLSACRCPGSVPGGRRVGSN
jgi:hypothetical protein